MSAKKSPAKRKSTKIEGETKDQAFVRLASKRVTKVLNDLRVVGNLGRYPHTDEQADAIFVAIGAAVQNAESQFAPKSAAAKATFTL